MKTIKILLLTISLCTFINGNAQTKSRDIIKVNYSRGCVSDFLVGMLKKQIQDPKEQTKMLNMMNEYKVYGSFYQDLKTKESIYVFDSISNQKKISATGYTYYIYKNKEGAIRGKELFMGKDINFKSNLKDLKWVIKEDQKEINGYQCKKAQLESNPKISVWFTPEIPIKSGPYMCYGLPGLVLEADSYFGSINALSISYERKENFQSKLKEVKQKMGEEKDKTISIKELFTKKENFQRMIVRGKPKH